MGYDGLVERPSAWGVVMERERERSRRRYYAAPARVKRRSPSGVARRLSTCATWEGRVGDDAVICGVARVWTCASIDGVAGWRCRTFSREISAFCGAAVSFFRFERACVCVRVGDGPGNAVGRGGGRACAPVCVCGLHNCNRRHGAVCVCNGLCAINKALEPTLTI